MCEVQKKCAKTTDKVINVLAFSAMLLQERAVKTVTLQSKAKYIRQNISVQTRRNADALNINDNRDNITCTHIDDYTSVTFMMDQVFNSSVQDHQFTIPIRMPMQQGLFYYFLISSWHVYADNSLGNFE